MVKVDLVNYFENRRLLGLEVFKTNEVHQITVFDILEYLPGELGSWLIIELIRARKVSYREIEACESLAKSLEGRALQALRQGLAHNRLHHRRGVAKFKRSGCLIGKWRDVRHISKKQVLEIYPSYRLVLPKIEVIHSDTQVDLWSGEVQVKNASLVFASEVTTVVGSDIFIGVDGEVYLDMNSFEGARSLNLINDQALLARSNERCVVSLTDQSAQFVEVAFWLGYPLMSAWGHWVYEGLFRIETFSRYEYFSTTPILIAEDVPESFTDFILAIYPEAKFLRIPAGTKVFTSDLIISPMRTFQPHNIFWSRNDENLKCNGEYQIARDIRNRVRDRYLGQVEFEKVRKFPEKVFLSREKALYRKSGVHERLEQIARESGYFVIDPGSLAPEDEILLFVGAQKIVGQTGSQMFLAFLAEERSNIVVIGSDFVHDAAGWAEMFKMTTSGKVQFILGERNYISEGFSEPLYHQDFTLSEEGFKAIQSKLS